MSITSHHFLAVGALSSSMLHDLDNGTTIHVITRMITSCNMHVLSTNEAHFAGDGRTIVWILAESHLVIHVWRVEGFVTLDLHICDYQRSNERNANNLLAKIENYCFDCMQQHERKDLALPVGKGMVSIPYTSVR